MFTYCLLPEPAVLAVETLEACPDEKAWYDPFRVEKVSEVEGKVDCGLAV